MTCTIKGGNRRKKIGGSFWDTLNKHTTSLNNHATNARTSLNNHTTSAREYMRKNYGQSPQNDQNSPPNNGPKNVEITNDIKNNVTEYSLVTCVLNCIATSNKLAKGSNYINNTKNRTDNNTSPDPDQYGNITQTSKDREILYRRALNSLSGNTGSLANYTMMQAAYNTGNAGYKTGKYAAYNTGKATYNTGKSAYNTGYNTGKSVYDKGKTYYANRRINRQNNGNGGTKRKRKY